jgi:hypothetical protein
MVTDSEILSMSLIQKINALGNAVSQHHFCGKFDGVAAVLYECVPNVNGTHFAAVVELGGETHVFPIMSHDAAKTAYYALINQFHADQNKESV